MEDLKAKLKKIAEGNCRIEDDPDFVADDYAGGNVDDAWEYGFKDGQVSLARELIELFFKD